MEPFKRPAPLNGGRCHVPAIRTQCNPTNRDPRRQICFLLYLMNLPVNKPLALKKSSVFRFYRTISL